MKSIGDSPIFWVHHCNFCQLIFNGKASSAAIINPSSWISKFLVLAYLSGDGRQPSSLDHHNTLYDLPDSEVLAPSNEQSSGSRIPCSYQLHNSRQQQVHNTMHGAVNTVEYFCKLLGPREKP